MTTGGWIVLFISVGAVTSFFVWTLSMVLSRKPDEIHSTYDETPDIED